MLTYWQTHTHELRLHVTKFLTLHFYSVPIRWSLVRAFWHFQYSRRCFKFGVVSETSRSSSVIMYYPFTSVHFITNYNQTTNQNHLAAAQAGYHIRSTPNHLLKSHNWNAKSGIAFRIQDVIDHLGFIVIIVVCLLYSQLFTSRYGFTTY